MEKVSLLFYLGFSIFFVSSKANKNICDTLPHFLLFLCHNCVCHACNTIDIFSIVFCYVTPVTLLLYFLLRFVATPVTLALSFNKKACPWRGPN